MNVIIETDRFRRLIFVAVLVFLFPHQTICSVLPLNHSASKPVIVIGWDGATWDILDPLIEQGRLPNLQRLLARGCSGRLISTPCFVSPPAWASIYSGKNPGKTDIFHFGRREDDLPRLGELSGNDVRAKRIWEIMTEAGRSSALVNVPLTYPARPLNGICIAGEFSPCVISSGLLIDVSQWERVPRRGGATGEAELWLHGTRLRVEIPFPANGSPSLTLRNPEALTVVVGPDIVLREWSNWFEVSMDDGEKGWARISLRSVGGGKARLWLSPIYRKVENMPGPIVYPPEWAGILVEKHEFFQPFVRWSWKPAIDHTRWLGDLCRDVQQRRNWDFFTCVFLAPDHMQHLYGDGDETVRVLEELDAVTGEIIDGAPSDALIVLLSDHGFSKYDRRVDINTWLGEMELAEFGPSGEVIPESSLAWSTMWSVYLNEQNLGIREKNRIVSSMLTLVPELVDLELSSRPIGLCLKKREEIYTGPFVHRAPHLVAVPSENTIYVPEFWDKKSVGSDGRRRLCRDTHRHDAWDHAIDGMVVLAGSGVRKNKERFEASVYDIVPTLLAYMGLPVADDMDGEVLEKAFKPGLLSPLERCVTYEDKKPEHQAPVERGSLEDRLRVLGYIR